MVLPTELPGIELTLVAWNNSASCSASHPGLGIDLGHWEQEGPGCCSWAITAFLCYGTPGSAVHTDTFPSIWGICFIGETGCKDIFFPLKTGFLHRISFVPWLYIFGSTHLCWIHIGIFKDYVFGCKHDGNTEWFLLFLISSHASDEFSGIHSPEWVSSFCKSCLVHLWWIHTGSWYIYIWVKYRNLRRIKDMAIYLFCPSSLTLLMWMFWVCQLSPSVGFRWVEARDAAKHLPIHRQPHSKELFSQNVNNTKRICKSLLTHSISHSIFSIHCTSLFLHFSCIFTCLEIIKHNTLKMLPIFFHLQY